MKKMIDDRYNEELNKAILCFCLKFPHKKDEIFILHNFMISLFLTTHKKHNKKPDRNKNSQLHQLLNKIFLFVFFKNKQSLGKQFLVTKEKENRAKH